MSSPERRKPRSRPWPLWLAPTVGIALVFVVPNLVRRLDPHGDLILFNFSAEGARTILSAFSASMLTFVVFVVSSMLIVVQLASVQLTPRIISTVFAEPRLKWVLGSFTFAYVYTISVSGRIADPPAQLPIATAIVCNLACIAVFFWFVHFLGNSLRPIAMLQVVARNGRDVVENVYPEPFDRAGEKPEAPTLPEGEAEVVEHVGSSGVVLSFDQERLLELALRADATIELVPQVGDFVARGDPLVRVRAGGRPTDAAALRSCVVIGPERSLLQDPRFAFRIMVDIANKALSPAINDPTTAVLALDQIHDLLLQVGLRRLGAGETRDGRGVVRLRFGTPQWPDFVSLAATEIRHFGANSIQVARRLRAMLEHLMQALPEPRRPALRQELALMQRAVERHFPDDEDRAGATVGDFQGIGSSEPRP